VRMHGAPVPVTRSQFDLLAALIARAGTAVSNRELLEIMWDAQWRHDTTPLQVHVSRLRRSLGESGSRARHIVTIRGYGYRFDPNPVQSQPVEPGHSTQPGATSDEVTEVTLRYDRELRLQEVSPKVRVLGWDPDEVLGTRFLPSRSDAQAALACLRHLHAIAMHELQGQFTAVTRTGSEVSVATRTFMDVDQRGEFAGLRAHWSIPATS